jgi:hypothetical protein
MNELTDSDFAMPSWWKQDSTAARNVGPDERLAAERTVAKEMQIG